MIKASNTRRTEALNLLAAFGAVVAIGIGTATAAISVGPLDQVNPAMRPLTVGRSIQVRPAYGPDDEDCIIATYRYLGIDGKPRIERKLQCAQ